MELKNLLDDVEKEVIELRRYFHENPEKSWNEYNTQKKIEECLEKYDIPYREASKTGVIGYLKCNDENAKTIGIRADIDALEMEEKSGVSFCSKNDGVMHSCGHDTHAAILLGTAKVLSEIRDELNVNVVFIFQPAEEFIEDSGAAHMKDEKEILECDRLIALHIWAMLECGKASLRKGPIMASSDTFDIEITGKGGHGAIPNDAIDPIIAGTQLVNNLQTIVSREVDPKETAVVSVTSFQSGFAANIIPEKAHLMGTTRSFNQEIVKSFPERLERICNGIALSTRTNIELDYHPGTPVTTNDDLCVDTGLKAAETVFGKENLVNLPRQMGGEDFSKYEAPYCLLLLGGGIVGGEKFPQHSPYFKIDENALKLGISYFVNYVLEYQKEI